MVEMNPEELEKIKEEMFIAGYLNGAIDNNDDYVKTGIDELVGWQARRAWENWNDEQRDQEARNRE